MKKNSKIGNLFNVFISSKDILNAERDIAERVIRSLNMNPLRIETDKWFATPNPDEYLQLIDKSNVVILIVDIEADSKSKETEDYYHFVKEEVNRAFSIGITVLAFFKCVNNMQREAIDSFVDDIQYKLFAHIFRNSSDLSSAIKDSILNELFRKYIYHPLLLPSNKKIYTETCSLVDKCKFRFYLSQQTPTILLGPRNERGYEKNLFQKIRDLIDNKGNERNMEIVFLYDSKKTKKELEENHIEYDLNQILGNIEYFRNIFQRYSEINLNIISRSSDIVQFVVSDTYYLFGNNTSDAALAVLDDEPVIVSELIKDIDQKTSYSRSSGLETFIEIFETISLK